MTYRTSFGRNIFMPHLMNYIVLVVVLPAYPISLIFTCSEMNAGKGIYHTSFLAIQSSV